MATRSKLGVLVLLGLLPVASCTLPAYINLGLQLVSAVNAAPEGQKICAAFEVLGLEDDPAVVADLINFALTQQGSQASFTIQDAETLLAIVRTINCEFASCLVAEIKALGPPEEDAAIADWVIARRTLLASIADNCPSPVGLTDDQLVDLVRLMQSLDL
ncbi:MAG: hypothetical protein JSU68_07150 [Phycisphaerales bacterium]|nr:MAG: hypothetical protein JSU68_07150 [Phycisphaerales bacterium]